MRSDGRRRRVRADLSVLGDAELLELRFSELGLRIGGSPIESDVDDLYARLARRGIRFRPHVWISTEWFSPDGTPGIAVPFFTTHPRLLRLERRMRGAAEGATAVARRRILRHEAGHALDTAYRLRRRADWRAIFGHASKRYPSVYPARPASRRFVQHLEHWYAQSHPTEDFAETFAVWLQPRARWQRQYAGWPALRKLEFVDRLMDEIAGARPLNSDRSAVAALAGNRRRLREHYRRSAPASLQDDARYDAWIRRVFAPRDRYPGGAAASLFLRRVRPVISDHMTRNPRYGAYLFEHVARMVRRRAFELKLVLRCRESEALRMSTRLHERIADDILERNREQYML